MGRVLVLGRTTGVHVAFVVAAIVVSVAAADVDLVV